MAELFEVPIRLRIRSEGRAQLDEKLNALADESAYYGCEAFEYDVAAAEPVGGDGAA